MKVFWSRTMLCALMVLLIRILIPAKEQNVTQITRTKRGLLSNWDLTTILTSEAKSSPTAVPICAPEMFLAYFDWASSTGPYSLKLVNLTALHFDVRTLCGPNSAGYQDGSASVAEFNGPMGLDISSDCSWLAVADTANNMIRRVEIASGAVSTIAGSTNGGYKDGTGVDAQFNYPYAVIISPDRSTLYVSDTISNVLRKIDLSSTSVTTVAGAARGSFPFFIGGYQDGIATNAAFNQPMVLDEY